MSIVEIEGPALERRYTREILVGNLSRPRVVARELAEEVASAHGLTTVEMLGKGPGSHEAHRQRARVDLYKLLRDRGMSYPAIGRVCGSRHHTTVMAALRSPAERVEAKLAAIAKAP